MNELNGLAAVLDEALDLGLAGEERWHRCSVSRGIELREGLPPVDRAAGIIRGYSVITEGPALGHHMQVDQHTLDQVVAVGNQAKLGVKSRFDHPNASNTSMGTFLGRTKNFRKFGNRVLGDLHLSDSAKEAPQGDLHSYVLGLAERDPQAFGASIVFEGKAEDQLNPDGTQKQDEQGNPLPRLARVEQILASDVVDEPAANAGGLFERSDSLASKITAFLNRWAAHDLLPQLQAIMAAHKEGSMSDTEPTQIRTAAQVDSARTEGFASGIKAERARVAAMHQSFAAVWGATPPAGELTIRDGLIELGIQAEEAETEFKKRKLTHLTDAAPNTTGGAIDQTPDTKTALSSLPLEDRIKAEWETNMDGVREEFSTLGSFFAFRKADAAGQVKILKK